MPSKPGKPRRSNRTSALLTPSSDWERGLAARMVAAVGSRSYREISQLTCECPETVRRYLNNGRPSVEFIAALCRGLRVSPEWMLYGAGESGAAPSGGADADTPPTAGGGVGTRPRPRKPLPARAGT